jgi:hypothetical protein
LAGDKDTEHWRVGPLGGLQTCDKYCADPIKMRPSSVDFVVSLSRQTRSASPPRILPNALSDHLTLASQAPNCHQPPARLEQCFFRHIPPSHHQNGVAVNCRPKAMEVHPSQPPGSSSRSNIACHANVTDKSLDLPSPSL